jgi:hypothetical protein
MSLGLRLFQLLDQEQGDVKFGELNPSEWAYLEQTTESSTKPLGKAKIVHPSHPLLGQEFLIFELKKHEGEMNAVLVLPDGTHMMVPLSWTNVGGMATHSSYPLGLFPVEDLLEVVQVVQSLKEPTESKK